MDTSYFFRIIVVIPIAALAMAFQPELAVLRKVFEEAVQRREREYGANDPHVAQAARDLAFFLKESGDASAARSAFSKALRIDEAVYGPRSRQVLAGMIAVASVSAPRDAEALLRRALASPSINSALAVPALSTLGDLRLAAGDRAGAASYWRLALPHAEVVNGEESDAVGKILNSLSQVVEGKEAVDLLERALLLARHLWGEQHPESATFEVNLSHALLKTGRRADAAEKARQAMEIFEAALGPRHPRVAVAAATLAEALRAQGDDSGAKGLYRRALEIDRQAYAPADKQTLQDERTLTDFLRATAAK